MCLHKRREWKVGEGPRSRKSAAHTRLRTRPVVVTRIATHSQKKKGERMDIVSRYPSRYADGERPASGLSRMLTERIESKRLM